jgi:hypothetical protein
MVVLHEIDVDSGIEQGAAVPGFAEEPAIVPESARRDDKHAGKFRLFDLQARPPGGHAEAMALRKA